MNTAAGVLVGIQWPREGRQDPWNSTVQPADWFKIASALVMIVVLGILALGALPWPARWRGDASPRDDPDIVRGHPWRAAALLGVLIVAPVYGFCCRSFDSFDAPWHWLGDWPFLAVASAALAGFVVVSIRRHGRRAWSQVLRGLVPWAVVSVVLAVIYAALSVLHARAMETDPSGGAWQSVWMPRYLGIIGPAVIVAAAALLMRLPTRPTRIVAIAILLGLNLVQGWARLTVDTEPPYELLARDLVDGRAEGAATRTVINVPGSGGKTGAWHANGHVGYYLAVQTQFPVGDNGLSRREINRTYWASSDLSPERLAAAMQEYPQVDRLVVWERFGEDSPEDALDGGSPYLEALGDAWLIGREQRYELRQFWNWRWLGWMRRTVYERDTSDPASRSDNEGP